MLFIVFPLHFACFVSGSRSFLCCCLIADVIHCTVLLPSFFAISISLRGLPVFSLSICFVPHYRRFMALLYIFSLLQFSRHEKFIYSFVPSWPMLFIAFLLLLYTRNFAWYNSFSFSLCFCVPPSSLLFCHYYRFFSIALLSNFALVFPA